MRRVAARRAARSRTAEAERRAVDASRGGGRRDRGRRGRSRTSRPAEAEPEPDAAEPGSRSAPRSTGPARRPRRRGTRRTRGGRDRRGRRGEALSTACSTWPPPTAGDGRIDAALDACYLALSLAPDDIALHLGARRAVPGARLALARGREARPPGSPRRPRRRRARRPRRRGPRGSRRGRRETVAGEPSPDRRRVPAGGPRCYTRSRMLPFVESLVRQITLTTVLDIAITAIFIYWLFSLIRGPARSRSSSACRCCSRVYALAQFLAACGCSPRSSRRGAVVGLFALVVVFQPELRRALERIGRVGLVRLAARAVRAAAHRARRERGRQAAAHPVARGPRRAHRPRAGDRPRGHRRDRRDAPCGPVARAPGTIFMPR